MNVLITGGAGFVGSHLVRSLLGEGAEVTVLDSFDSQVHARRPGRNRERRLRTVRADVRDPRAVERELRRADAVIHLAAAVGIGQSQYQIRRYVDVNVNGTANLLDILANGRHRVRKFIVAGSMSSYGEGAYDCERCGRVRPALRTAASVRQGRWEPCCPYCQGALRSIPTRETDRFLCSSIYAVTKMAQEELVMNFGAAYDIPVVTLRLFSTYGPGQSLSNPYAGVAAIFLSRLRNKRSPLIYEDGGQTRDFVSVHDVVEAFRLALRKKEANGRIFNVGTGVPTPVLELARRLARRLQSTVAPKALRKFRSGDIRHCSADLGAIQSTLGYRPKVTLEEGFGELVEWAASAAARDSFDRAQRELSRHGLI